MSSVTASNSHHPLRFSWITLLLLLVSSSTNAFLITQPLRLPQRSPSMLAAGGGGSSVVPPPIARIEDLVDKFDAFLIDQWGVMHDGHAAYPGSIECMTRLKEAGKTIILLSNSSKRRHASVTRLAEMGFSPDECLEVITSGELTTIGMLERKEAPFNTIKGNRCIVMGNAEDDIEFVEDMKCQFAASVEEADFLLARGSFSIDWKDRMERFSKERRLHQSPVFLDLARAAAARNLPMLVANPDLIRPGGDNDPMPGVLGQIYSDLGGEVIYIGKPHPYVYKKCRDLLKHRHGDDAVRIVAVGDSMFNDIAGAHKEGYASILVADGIHADALGLPQGGAQPVDSARLEQWLKKEFNFQPTYVVPTFGITSTAT